MRTEYLLEEFRRLLREVGPGRMAPTAYDTAWIARLVEIGEPIGEQAMEWLRAHQLPDGSWGAEFPHYRHDRVISTLAAITALARRGHRQDDECVRRAEIALEREAAELDIDPSGETIGFELIVPTLWHDANVLGAIHSDGAQVLERISPMRSAKLAALPRGIVNRLVTVAFSLEMAGFDERYLLDEDNLQEYDGSVSYSPSATAYFALYVRRGDKSALEYLRKVAPNGVAPDVFPFDVFEPAWVLWNLKVAGLKEELLPYCQRHLNFLWKYWDPEEGIGFAARYAPRDADETSIVYSVLTYFGYPVDVRAVFQYETPYYFRCFDLESTLSLSANVHVLDALLESGVEPAHPAVHKVLRLLQATQVKGAFWLDKWHSSPYYATSHTLTACMKLHREMEMLVKALEWLLDTQNLDGSWGFYNLPTAEETAYALQSLILAKNGGYQIPDEAIVRGRVWLEEHMDPPYPPLWIGKCLYAPEYVVRSAILSALLMVERNE